MTNSKTEPPVQELEGQPSSSERPPTPMDAAERFIREARAGVREGDLGTANHRYTLATQALERAGEADARLPQVLEEHARVLVRARRSGDALKLLERAEAAAKSAGPLELARLASERGVLLRDLGRHSEARDALEAAR